MHNKDVRLHNGVIGVGDVKWSDEDSHTGGAQALEAHSKIQDCGLVAPRRSGRHDERSVDDLVAIPVIGHRIQISSGERVAVWKPFDSRLGGHVHHRKDPFVACRHHADRH